MYFRLKITPDNQTHDLNDYIDKIYSYLIKTGGVAPKAQAFILVPIYKGGEIYYEAIVHVETLTEDARLEGSLFIDNLIYNITYFINNGYTYTVTYRTIADESADRNMENLSMQPRAKGFPDPNTNPMGAIMWEHLVLADSPMGKIKYANDIVTEG